MKRLGPRAETGRAYDGHHPGNGRASRRLPSGRSGSPLLAAPRNPACPRLSDLYKLREKENRVVAGGYSERFLVEVQQRERAEIQESLNAIIR